MLSQQLATLFTTSCSDLLELNILVETTSTEKIQKLATAVKESQDEIVRVRFEMQLQISELQLKLQPMTPPEVREQCEATIEEGMTMVEDVVKGCKELFEQAMELWTSLQEDPALQKIGVDIKENQRQFNEILLTMRTLPLVQDN